MTPMPASAGHGTQRAKVGSSARHDIELEKTHRHRTISKRVWPLSPLCAGGIDSGETALAKIEAGATLLQLYSSLIYEGIGLVGRIKQHLAEAVTTARVDDVSALVGRRTKEWAAKSVEV